jgi:uncharacterized membrane protein YdbT with pleckstrin-like domain
VIVLYIIIALIVLFVIWVLIQQGPEMRRYFKAKEM